MRLQSPPREPHLLRRPSDVCLPECVHLSLHRQISHLNRTRLNRVEVLPAFSTGLRSFPLSSQMSGRFYPSCDLLETSRAHPHFAIG